MSHPIDIAWAAGLFEGEGSLFIANMRKYSYPRLNLKTTDLDVLQKFKDVVEVGSIYKATTSVTQKEAWYWQVNGLDKCKKVIQDFWPYLGERRKAKAIEIGLAPVVE